MTYALSSITPQKQADTYWTKNPVVYDGYVTSCGPAEILEGSAIVHVPFLRMNMKCINALSNDASVGGTGKHVPLVTGDHVRIQFLRGDSNAPIITGKYNPTHYVANYFQGLVAGVPAGTIPTPNLPSVTPAGQRINLNVPGISQIPEGPGLGLAIPYEIVSGIRITDGKPGSYATPTPRYATVSFQTPTTTVKQYFNKNITQYTNNISATLDTPTQGDTLPIEEVTKKYQFLVSKLAEYNRDLYIDQGNVRFSTGSNPNFETNNKGGFFSRLYYREAIAQAAKEITQAAQTVKENQAKNTCIKNTLEQQKTSALDSALQAITSQVISLVNSQLPSYAQISDDGSGSYSVGPVKFDNGSGNLSLNGEVFSPLVNQGLDQVNKLLPGYAKVSLSTLGLSLAGTQIPIAQLTPGTTQTVNADTTVATNTDGVVKVTTGNKTYDVGVIARDYGTGVVNSVITNGIGSLNSKLPDYFQAKPSLSFVNDKLVGKLSLGPVNFGVDGSDTSVSVDKTQVGRLLDTQATNVIEQLPPPAAFVARLAWQQFGGFTKLLGESSSTNTRTDTITRPVDACGKTYALPPKVGLTAGDLGTRYENAYVVEA